MKMKKWLFLDRVGTERRYVAINQSVQPTVRVFPCLAESESVRGYLTTLLTSVASHMHLVQLFV